MFCAFWVEQYDAAVVKVKGYRSPRIVLNAMPVFRILVDILEDDDRLVITLLEQTMVISFNGNDGHVYFLSLIHDICRLTACFQIILEAHPINNSTGLSVVGKAKIETSQLTAKPAISLPQRLIGVIRPMLIDDISHQPVIGRRLNAEASAVVDSAKPNESLM